jgi:hypothetical protein
VSAACTVCSHEGLRDIDAALVAGTSQRQVARDYGLSKDAMRRHFDSHLSPGLATLGALPSSGSDDPRVQLVDEVNKLKDIATGLMGRAYTEGKVQQSLAALREARACLELKGRLEGALNDRPQVQVLNVLGSTEWLQVRGAVMRALEAFPDARLAVAQELRALERGDAA